MTESVATRAIAWASCLCGALLLAACDAEIGESFSDMFEIRTAVLELSRADDVGVHIHNGIHLTVNLVNAPVNDGTAAARRELAATVARKAFEMYRARESLERVYVVFAFYERKYVLMTHTRTIDVVEFEATDLRVQTRRSTRLAGASR